MFFWTVGGNRSTQRRPTHVWGEHANSTQEGPSWKSNLEPCDYEAAVLTTVLSTNLLFLLLIGLNTPGPGDQQDGVGLEGLSLTPVV